MFRVRSVAEELEAHLVDPAGTGRAAGKAERKRYGTGEERLKLRASGVAAPDGAHVDVRLDGDLIARAEFHGGRVALVLESPGVHVPAVRAGQVLALALADTIVLSGTFRAE
ncbi:MAG: hypothetical protein IT294_01220 [Deltaproteobacteria bacterium]|nr:hypothetical protein [Deltaproteobacteria bacterium]